MKRRVGFKFESHSFQALVKSPYLDRPGDFEQGNQWVFYDVVGIFTIFYPVVVGQFVNYSTVLAILALIYYRIRKRFYGTKDLLISVFHHVLSGVIMFGQLCYLKYELTSS